MKSITTALSLLFYLIVSQNFSAQSQKQETRKMEWFQDAKLGIFVHWGIYSVNGISESWAFFNNYISHDNYMKQLNGFTASQYNPDNWTNLIKNSGAKYAVITTKHHDGVSLWNSQAEKANTTAKNAAAKKDVLTPFLKSLQKTGLKTGLYYSLPDWSHPYYDINTRTQKRYELKNDAERWNKYIQYYQTQLNELSTQYQPDLLWFDGDWEHSSEEWNAQQTLNNLRKYNKNIIINSRLNHLGDYATPEQGVPVTAPKDEYWELCYTMNDSWGFQPFDNNYKTANMIVRTLVDCISMGGNLLIDIGPKEDGTIPQPQIDILKNLGRWTNKYPEAVYGTRRGLPSNNYNGKSAVSKDGKKLFLYLENAHDVINLHGVKTTPKSVKILADNQAKVTYQLQKNGDLEIKLTNVQFDQDVSVVEINFNEKPLFQNVISPNNVSMNEISTSKSTTQALHQLTKRISSTKNNDELKNWGITQDGQNMKIKTLANINPEVMEWISKHAESLYETGEALLDGHFNGYSALSKDKQTLYLFVEGKPSGPISLKGIKNNISRIRIVGEGSIINHHIFNKLYWSSIPGIIYIDIPKERLDKNITVIAVLLDKPLEVYREDVKAIESNL